MIERLALSLGQSSYKAAVVHPNGNELRSHVITFDHSQHSLADALHSTGIKGVNPQPKGQFVIILAGKTTDEHELALMAHYSFSGKTVFGYLDVLKTVNPLYANVTESPDAARIRGMDTEDAHNVITMRVEPNRIISELVRGAVGRAADVTQPEGDGGTAAGGSGAAAGAAAPDDQGARAPVVFEATYTRVVGATLPQEEALAMVDNIALGADPSEVADDVMAHSAELKAFADEAAADARAKIAEGVDEFGANPPASTDELDAEIRTSLQFFSDDLGGAHTSHATSPR